MNLRLIALGCIYALSCCFLSSADLVDVPSTPNDIQGDLEPGSNNEPFHNFNLLKAPKIPGSKIEKGDRLAIIGDSITEQKMYSRIMETYLTVCVPELEIGVRQFGWSGETAAGFLKRMESDCLRFKPTLATLCYGMNDHRYRTYTQENGNWYLNNYSQVVERLKAAGSKVILGSPGCVGKVPGWTNSDAYTLTQLNQNLATLRNIDVMLAKKMDLPFADVFWNMLKASHLAGKKYGTDYALPGKDGVHPEWSGQLVMAYTFLKSLGLDGNIGTIHLNLKKEQAKASRGHKVLGYSDGTISIRSTRYPFCATGPMDKDNSIRSGMTLVPFNKELNRFRLSVRGGSSKEYAITWGGQTKSYKSDELKNGINLANDFVENPFLDAFRKVDSAVLRKQQYETRQIKQLFHGQEFQYEPAVVVELTEKVREKFVKSIEESFIPVTHEITVTPLN